MSEGPRISHARAAEVAAVLFDRWELAGVLADHSAACVVVGSVRRGRAEVGDLEIVAPLPVGCGARKLAPADDALFQRINATMSNPWRDTSLAELFAVPAGERPGSAEVLGSAIRGLKPGFLACSLMLRPWPGVEIPCQVYRYTPDNRGWMLIERTGPRDFGMWFLGRWKQRFGIPLGVEGRQASVGNHLVDASGQVVSVPTEEEAFRLAGVGLVPPRRRDAFIQRVQASREALR